MRSDLKVDIKELQPDVIVERYYLHAKYYHYDPVDMLECVEFNETVENLLVDDNVVTAHKPDTSPRIQVALQSIR